MVALLSACAPAGARPATANVGAATTATAESSSVSVLGFDHVGLTVSDLEVSRAFFTDALGFAVRGRDESYPAYFLVKGTATLTLWQAKDEPTVAFDRRRNVGLHHLALSVASFETLNALYDNVRTYEGVRIDFAPELNRGGPAMHMMFYEPSGNRIELVHPPN